MAEIYPIAGRSKLARNTPVPKHDCAMLAKFAITFTYLLCAMWHIRPQHNPTNHLCQLLPIVPHSSSSIPLFPFLSPPSFSVLSLVFPVFAAPLGLKLMQSCSHFCPSLSLSDSLELSQEPPSVRGTFNVTNIHYMTLFFFCRSLSLSDSLELSQEPPLDPDTFNMTNIDIT